MFTIGCNVPDITVSAVKTYEDYVVYKMRAVAKRPGIALENVQVFFRNGGAGVNHDLLIKMPSGRAYKQYIELEAAIMTLINKKNANHQPFCSIAFTPAHGRVFQCNLTDSSKTSMEDGFYDVKLVLLSCKCTKKKTYLTWDLVNIKANDTNATANALALANANANAVVLAANGIPLPASDSECGSDSDSDNDSDNGSECIDADAGPSPEEVDEIRRDTVGKLETEIERLATIASAAEENIKTYMGFLKSLRLNANNDIFILGTVQKANSILETTF